MTVELMNRLKRLTITLVFLIACFSQVVSQENEDTFSEFMGANTFLGEYNEQYLKELSYCVKWIREYHPWTHYERENDQYSWSDTTNREQDAWARHYELMESCQRLGIQVLMDVLNRPEWANKEPIPINTGDGSESSDYTERIEFVSQLVARYGSTKIDTNLLESDDKLSGLGYVKYFEDDNEPDYWWKTPPWEPVDYAQYCNAVHDGFGLETDEEYPLLGIKSVDPDAQHVIAGLAALDTTYISEILQVCDGRIPFDVLNVHIYCSDHGVNSFSPENERYGLEAVLTNYLQWKERVLPNMPVWITEFGWDTFEDEEGKHSYVYAGEQSQANYLLRAYLILRKLGFEKAFMYMVGDTNSKNTLQYATSGLFTDQESGRQKKLSFYYLATMQALLGETNFVKAPYYKKLNENQEIYDFLFRDDNSQKTVHVLWTRKVGSAHDSGQQSRLAIDVSPEVKRVKLVRPCNLDMDGDTVIIRPVDGTVDVLLSETPKFLIIDSLTQH